MKIAINWFEITLPTTDLAVPVQTCAAKDGSTASSSKIPRYAHRVIQRRGDGNIRLLHITDSPPEGTQMETLRASDDPNFVKLVVEESFSHRLTQQGFSVYGRHVGRNAYRLTEESLWDDIYTFLRGLEFRAFYFMGTNGLRWGIVLNYATSQHFSLSLEDLELRKLAIGKRVIRTTDSQDDEAEHQKRTGILLSVDDDTAVIDLGGEEPAKEPPSDWTLICRRELLVDYVTQTKGTDAAAQLTRRLQQASFSLTESGRMNTSLAKSQVQAIQQMLREHDLDRLTLPLPDRPPATLSGQPLTIAE